MQLEKKSCKFHLNVEMLFQLEASEDKGGKGGGAHFDSEKLFFPQCLNHVISNLSELEKYSMEHAQYLECDCIII